MSSGMFRGKESSNRIELSRLVQELLNFGVFSSLWLWGVGVDGGGGGWVGGWGWGGGGAPHTHAHACACMHAHTCTCMHGKHDNFMQMAAPIGGIPYDVICMCMHMCMHMCGGTLSPPPPTPTPQGDPRNQNSIALELIEIFQFCLKIWNLWRLPHPWVGVWFGQWVDEWGQVKLDLIEIIQFCLKIYDL